MPFRICRSVGHCRYVPDGSKKTNRSACDSFLLRRKSSRTVYETQLCARKNRKVSNHENLKSIMNLIGSNRWWLIQCFFVLFCLTSAATVCASIHVHGEIECFKKKWLKFDTNKRTLSGDNVISVDFFSPFKLPPYL